MTSPEDVPPQTTCPECRGDNLYAHGGISARGGYGPDLLPGASGIFASAKMRSVVCRDCGLVRFYAGNEALARITPKTAGGKSAEEKGMQPDFWLQRWQQGQIGFHRGEVMPLLEKHWPALQLAPGSRVLVPLCGKSLDMHWLAAQGYRVLGVELSPLAVEQFFAEAGLQPERSDSALGEHFTAGPIEIIRGDAFALNDETLAGIAGLYDRAALIALPPELRQRYRDTMYARLPAGCRALVITLEYPQAEKAGPPFSVEQAEVESFAPSWRVELTERRDILAQEPGFRAEGVSALSTAVYRMQRAGD